MLNDNEKLVPASIDTERVILAAILGNNALYEEASCLSSDDFSLDANRRIFARIRDLRKDGHEVDESTLVAEFESSGELERVGGSAYLFELPVGVVQRKSIKPQVEILQKAAQRRDLLNLARKIISKAAESEPSELCSLIGQEAALISERSGSGQGLELVCAASIEPERIEWLWPGILPLCQLTNFVGQPDVGKSVISCDLAARVSTGRNWPDGTKNLIGPADVLMLIGEDRLADTVVPRLKAAGADLGRVHFIESEDDGNQGFSFDRDMAKLRNCLKQNPAIRYINVDPITNYLGDRDANKDQEVRSILKPLRKLAEDFRCAAETVMHFNKAKDAQVIDRIGGSKAWVAFPRMVWGFMKSTDDPDTSLMLRIKGNIARDDGGMQYRTQARGLTIQGEPTDVPIVEWMGKSLVKADDALAAAADRTLGKVAGAAKWLENYIAANGGEVKATDTYVAAEHAGFNKDNLKDARARLGVKCEQRPSGKGPWYWIMPEQDQEDMPAGTRTSSPSSPLGIVQLYDNKEDKVEGLEEKSRRTSLYKSTSTVPLLSPNGINGLDQKHLEGPQEGRPSSPSGSPVKISPWTNRPFPPPYAKYRWADDVPKDGAR